MIPPRILITGANGLVGQAVVRRLGRWPGADVLATGRAPEPRLSAFHGGYAPLDLLDADAVERAFQDFAPRVVVHAAGQPSVDACAHDKAACWAVNVEATARLAAACARHGARLLLLSSDFVFDGNHGPYAETDRPAPRTTYGRSKLAAENALRTSRLTDWAVVRTTLVFGAPEGDDVRPDVVRWLVDRLGDGEAVRVARDQWRTPTYDDDLADGIERILRFGKTGVFHLAGREWLTPVDLAHHVAETFGLEGRRIVPTPTAEIHPDAPRPLRAGLVILRAESELGYRPRPLAEALRRLAARLGQPVGR